MSSVSKSSSASCAVPSRRRREARAEAETDVRGLNGGSIRRHQQRAETDTLFPPVVQTAPDEHTILRDERHEIRDRAERDEVERFTKIEPASGRRLAAMGS